LRQIPHKVFTLSTYQLVEGKAEAQDGNAALDVVELLVDQ
jgi:hypothetical protein